MLVVLESPGSLELLRGPRPEPTSKSVLPLVALQEVPAPPEFENRGSNAWLFHVWALLNLSL